MKRKKDLSNTPKVAVKEGKDSKNLATASDKSLT